MEVSWNDGTPSHHPLLDGISHNKNPWKMFNWNGWWLGVPTWLRKNLHMIRNYNSPSWQSSAIACPIPIILVVFRQFSPPYQRPIIIQPWLMISVLHDWSFLQRSSSSSTSRFHKIWCLPKNRGKAPIIHFSRRKFHSNEHPVWGTPILGHHSHYGCASKLGSSPHPYDETSRFFGDMEVSEES